MKRGTKHTTKTKLAIANSQTKLTIPEVIQKTKDYLKQYEDKKKKEVPTIAGLAVFLGLSLQTIYNKANQSANFQKLLDDLMLVREDKLINMGLSRKLDSGMSMFLLRIKHGYKEQPNSLTQNNYNLTTEVLADLMKLGKRNK